MSQYIDALRTNIKDRLRVLDDEASRLREAIGLLGEDEPVIKAPQLSVIQEKPKRRAHQTDVQGQVMKLVQKKDLTRSQVVRELGGTSSASRAVRRLIEKGKLVEDGGQLKVAS